jgi:hypothetical protein
MTTIDALPTGPKVASVALTILSRVGAEVHHVVVGAIMAGFVMAFLVPSTTARVACLRRRSAS